MKEKYLFLSVLIFVFRFLGLYRTLFSSIKYRDRLILGISEIFYMTFFMAIYLAVDGMTRIFIPSLLVMLLCTYARYNVKLDFSSKFENQELVSVARSLIVKTIVSLSSVSANFIDFLSVYIIVVLINSVYGVILLPNDALWITLFVGLILNYFDVYLLRRIQYYTQNYSSDNIITVEESKKKVRAFKKISTIVVFAFISISMILIVALSPYFRQKFIQH